MSFKLNKHILLVLAVLLMLVLIPTAFASEMDDVSVVGVDNQSAVDGVSQPTGDIVVESVEQSAVDDRGASDDSDVLGDNRDYENNVVSGANDVIYVDGFDGSGGSGTSGNPYHSLKEVLNSSNLANHINLLPGTYDFGNTTVGLYEKDFTLTAMGDVIFTSSETLFNKYGTDVLTLNGIRFENITSSSSAILYTGSSVEGTLIFNNCSFINNKGANLIDTSYNIYVNGCTFINNEATGTTIADGGLIENIFGSPIINITYSIFIGNKIHYSNNGFNPIIVNGIGNSNPSIYFEYNFVNNNNPLTQDEIIANGGVLNSYSGVNLAVTVPSGVSAGDSFDLVINFTKTDGSVLDDSMPNLDVSLAPAVNVGSIPVTITNNGGKGQYAAENRAYTENVDVKYGEYVLDTFEFYVASGDLLNPELTVPESMIVDIGNSVNINAAHLGNGVISYVSADESVVTVDANGFVTGVGEGIATITVAIAATNTYGEDTKQVIVMVRNPADANVIYVDGFDESDGGSGIKVDPYHSLINVLVSENSGKEIRLLPGTYEFTNTIDLKNNTFVINAVGGDVIFTTSSNYMFKVNEICNVAFNGIKFKDSTVDGSVITRTFSSAMGTLSFNNCDFVNNTGDCLIKSSCNLNIKGCTFIDNKLTGTGLSNAGLIHNYYASTNTIDISCSIFIGNEISYTNNGANPLIVDWKNGNGPSVIFKYNFFNDNNAISNDEIAYNARITKGDYTIITATAPSGATAGHAVDLVVNFTKSNGGALDDYMPNLNVSLVTTNVGTISATIIKNGGNGQYTAYTYATFNENVDVKVKDNTITTFQFQVTGVDYISSLSPSVVDEYVIGDNEVIVVTAYYNPNKASIFSNDPMYIYINGNEIRMNNVLAKATSFTFDLADYNDNLVEGINNISVHPKISTLRTVFGQQASYTFNELTLNAVKITPEINVTANAVTYGENVVVNVAGSVAGDYTVAVNGVTKDVVIAVPGEFVSVNFGVLDADTYAIVAEYAETANYNAAVNDTESVIVGKADVTIDVSVSNVTYGEDVVVEVTCSVAGNYNIGINGESKIVSLNNGSNRVNFSGLDAGSYTVNASYDGDNNHNQASVSTNVKVNKATPTINVSAEDIKYGEALVVNVELSGDVARRAIVTIGNESQYVSLTNGIGSVKFTRLNAGTYTVTATYKGDSNYDAKAVANTTVTVKKATPTIKVTTKHITAGEDLVVNVKVLDDISRRVVVTIGNESKLVSLTNGTGSVIFSGLTKGTYTVFATYHGDANYDAKGSANTTVTVYKGPACINATAEPVAFGEDVVIDLQLPSEISRRVNVTLGNETKLVKLTNGTASVKFSGLAVGTYNAIVTYNGDDNYTKSSVNVTANVVKATPDIQITTGDIAAGEPLTVDVQLPADVSRRPIVTVNGESKLVSLKDGAGSVKFTGLEAGTYDVVVSYNGDSNFKPSSNSTTIVVIE